jgi:hypothetical protein
MTIVKWVVSNYAFAPERKEYDKETECFYLYRTGKMKVARRDAKSSLYYRYFNSEAEALECIRQRSENKAEQKRVDQIRRHAVELLEALEIAEERLLVAEHHLDLGEDDSISFEHAILTARAAIAKAKGTVQ